jgi:hypothetical protein
VEEQDKRTEEEQADVEAHKKKEYLAGEEAPKDEGESEDFELHSKKGHQAL